jgi:hypothetical protein
MVGAIYRKKCDEVEWVASGGLKAPDFRKGFIEVEGLGMGCFLIRRDAIPPLIDKFPDKIYPYIAIADFRWQGPNRTLAFFDCMRTPEGKVSEDISFCRRYREAGGKVWATTAYQTLHEGPKIFAGCFGKSRELDLQQEALARRAAELVVRVRDRPAGEVCRSGRHRDRCWCQYRHSRDRVCRDGGAARPGSCV